MTARDLAERPEARAGRGSSPSLRERSGTSALAGRYRSLFVIGRGGMGSVEAALEIEPPARSRPALDERGSEDPPYERIVALKRLLPDGARDKRRADMFLREARLAALLDHPNIVGAYDYGEIDGELYIAMEYVEGQPLSRVLQALSDAGQNMPTRVAAWVLAEVCRGLHAAHELTDPSTGAPLQLVHRDVSPQNVMIAYDGHVRLLDFGVAKIETESVTKTGEVKGKTAYMSPEQAMGEPLDRRSDLFGVGAVLFECLALRRMWGAGTDMEVIRKLALESPPSLADVGVDVPEALVDLHARLVARDAKERPATAMEVADELARIAGDPDATRAELRAILDAHFAEQANERRARLTAALREIAPRQADELRESLLPASVTTPIRMRGELEGKGARGTSAPPEASPARAENRPGAAPASASRTKIAVGLVGAAAAALVAWRLAGGDATPPPAATPSSGPAKEPIPMSPTTASEAARSQGPSPATSGAPATLPESSRVPREAAPSPASPPSSAPRVTSTTSPRSSAPRVTSTTSPRSSAPQVTSTSTSTSTSTGTTTGRRPTDVDEKPF